MDARVHPTTLQTRLDDFVARIQAETRVPGIALAVSVDGARAYAQAGSRAATEAQPLTRDARFSLGCAGKLLVAIAALELDAHGALDVAAPIARYLPELRRSPTGNAVRVAHLLSHTSGYRGTQVLDPRTRSWSWGQLVDYLTTAEALFAPGDVFSYEHTETVLLGEIVQRVAGGALDRVVDERVMAPLGLDRADSLVHLDASRFAGRHLFDASSNRFVAQTAYAALSAVWRTAFSERTATTPDLIAVGEAMFGAEAAGRSILAESTLRRLQSPVVRLPATAGGPLRELQPVAFGLGTALLRDGSSGSTGVSAGQCVGLRFDPRARVCVAVGLNAMAPHLRDFVLTAVLRDLAGRLDSEEPDPFAFALDELAGLYVGPGNGVVEVAHENDRLHCLIGREHEPHVLKAELSLDREGRARLHSPLPHLSLGFLRAPDGGIGLMLGLSAYKRRNTKRPFHKNSPPPHADTS